MLIAEGLMPSELIAILCTLFQPIADVKCDKFNSTQRESISEGALSY